MNLLTDDPAYVAQATKGMRGARSKTAIARLRRERAKHHAPPTTLTLTERLEARVLATYAAEIHNRGGDTIITGRKGSVSGRLRLIHRRRDTATGRPLYLFGVDGWRYYSSRTPSRFVSLRYLCGRDDNGDFAVRVKGTVATVGEAIDALTPAEVRCARWQRRQGDIYAIPTTARGDTPTGWVDNSHTHWWNAETRYLTHRPREGRRHRPLKLPSSPVRFVQQKTWDMD